jgi:hypothetical protein
MSLKGRKVFVRKNGFQKGGELYKWTPFDDITKKKKKIKGRGYFCTTPLGSQGNDFVVTYTYNSVIVGGVEQRWAYVQCNYVE